MQCPVCSRQARNLTPATLDGVVIGCDGCGPYRVSGGAYYEFVRLREEKRLAALQTAKLASRYGWPMIDGRCVQAQ